MLSDDVCAPMGVNARSGDNNNEMGPISPLILPTTAPVAAGAVDYSKQLELALQQYNQIRRQ